MEPPLTKI